MKKAALYGIIAAVVVAVGVGIAFAAVSMNNAAEPAVASQGPSSNNDVRVIKHAMGETEITGTPERVVALYSVQVGNVRALGVMPVGVADLDFQNGLLSPIGLQLSEDVVHVGTPSEPNFETLLQLEPDLIVGGAFQAEIYDELSEIAPTILFAEEPTEELNELEVAEQNFMAIADALNRHDKGVAYLERLDSLYAEVAAKIDQAGLAGTEIVLIESWLQDDGPYMYVMKENAMFSLILNETGLKSAVPADYVLEPEYENAGWYQTSMEGLSTLDGPDVRILNSHAGSNPLESSPLWDNLEFAQNGHVYSIGQIRTDQFAYAEMLVNRVVDAMTGEQQSASGETRTISHAMGTTEITGTPERVVLLDTHSFSIMMELGIEPVGVQSWEEDEWVGEGKIFWEAYYPGITQMWPDVVNTGNEPNLEVITQLEPDLIIAPSWGSEIYDDLSEIAPTILFTDEPPEGSGLDQLEAAERVTMGIADALNRHEEGVAMIERMHAELEENSAKLEEAGIKGKKFVFAQTWTEDDSSVFIRVWTGVSKGSIILEEMGIANAAPNPEGALPDGRWDAVGLEGLSTLDGPDVHFMYMPSGDDDAIADQWTDNPVWNNLSFVKEGRVYNLGPNLYMYGGPQKDAEFADEVVEVLTTGN